MRRTLSGCILSCLALLVLPGCHRELPADVQADAKAVTQIRSLVTSTADVETSEAAPAADPTGFATFTGKFIVNGNPPVMPPAPVQGGDASYCTRDGMPRLQTVVVGPDGGLANVLVYVDMPIPTDWEHPDDAERREITLAGPAAFDQKGCMFLSHVFAMRGTQLLEVKNSDAVSHNTNIKGGGRAKGINDNLPPGATTTYTPGGASRGPFEVICNIHTWMNAYISVHDNPYFAVTDDQGQFEIKNLPAGVELTFRVWQEKVKNNWKGVTVNGDEAKWAKGKFKLTLEPEQTQNWEVVVDASILQ